MSDSADDGGAIDAYLAPEEAVASRFSLERSQNGNGDPTSLEHYALTDRRFVEVYEGTTDDGKPLTEFESIPLREEAEVSVRHAEGVTEESSDGALGGILVGILGLLVVGLGIQSGEQVAFLVGGGMIIVGVAILLSGSTTEQPGSVRLEIAQHGSATTVSLPEEGSEFAESVAAGVGKEQR